MDSSSEATCSAALLGSCRRKDLVIFFFLSGSDPREHVTCVFTDSLETLCNSSQR